MPSFLAGLEPAHRNRCPGIEPAHSIIFFKIVCRESNPVRRLLSPSACRQWSRRISKQL